MAAAGLKIARGFTLPLELVTEATAIVATRGAGKSSGSAVIVEEAFALGVQSVIFDRTGVYHGLRSNAAGNGPGLPIYVLGGPHGDVPLEPQAGALIADLVVDSGHSFVLDLSDFSKSAAIRFSADFLERLYDRKARSRTTLLLVMDEAHFYAPQTPRGGFKGDSARLMGAMEDVVGLGRSRGLGVVLTTQRTQALNKAILDLIETLLVMRMLSPRARDAVKDWIREKQEDDRVGVISTLDSLPTGTAWIWSPLRGILEKVALRRIKTFDSYKTPTPGETRVEPTVRKELDLDALGEQMKATVERAKENDPKELRKRIATLERELAEKPAADGDSTLVAELQSRIAELEAREPEIVQVFPDALKAAIRGDYESVASHLESVQETLSRARERIDSELESLPAPPAHATDAAGDTWKGNGAAAEAPPALAAVGRETFTFDGARDSRRAERVDATNGDVKFGKGERTILGILAGYPNGRTSNELAFLAGYSAKASTVAVILSNLRKSGYVHPGNQPVRITQEGLDLIGGPIERPTGRALLEQWLQHPRVGKGEREVILTLLDLYPEEPTQDRLCEITGYSPTASTMAVILSSLRKLGLVEKGRRQLTPEFVDAVREGAVA